jgi:hypothetical protein
MRALNLSKATLYQLQIRPPTDTGGYEPWPNVQTCLNGSQ